MGFCFKKGDEMTLSNISEKEELPTGIEDMSLPTMISVQTELIQMLTEQRKLIDAEIAEAEIERQTLINRAKECNIYEDENYKLVDIPVYPKKHVDVTALRTLYPEKYAQILANIKQRILDAAKTDLQRTESFISQNDVKAIFKDKFALARLIPETSEPSEYKVSVVRK
jgi:hypothetical protein